MLRLAPPCASRPLRAVRRARGASFRLPPTAAPAAPAPLVDAAASDPPLPPPPSFDAVLVLGGGLRDDGGLPPWVTRRLDVAASLRATAPVASAPPPPIVLLGAGTPHKPPPTDPVTGRPLSEATAGARYLVAAHGVPAGSILKETQSYDTVGNALFGLTTHAAPRALRSLAVVTSAFHMARTRAVFDVVFGLGGKALGGEGGGGGDGGATPSSSSSFFRLHYVAACDAGTASPAALAARAEREAASTRAWVEATTKFATLADLHAWVFATHLCYATGRQDEWGGASNAGMDPRVLETY